MNLRSDWSKALLRGWLEPAPCEGLSLPLAPLLKRTEAAAERLGQGMSAKPPGQIHLRFPNFGWSCKLDMHFFHLFFLFIFFLNNIIFSFAWTHTFLGHSNVFEKGFLGEMLGILLEEGMVPRIGNVFCLRVLCENYSFLKQSSLILCCLLSVYGLLPWPLTGSSQRNH